VSEQQQSPGTRSGVPGSARAASAARSTLRRLSAAASVVELEDQLPSPELAAFVDSLATPDDLAAMTVINAHLDRGVSAEAIVLDLLAPGAREVGRRWEEDEADFVTVTLALGRLQRILRSLAARLAASGTAVGPIPGTVCVSCLPDEQHTFGASICAEFFARDGWQVVMGGPLSRTDTVELVRQTHTDLVALSVSRSSSFAAVSRLISRVRRASKNRHVVVFIGGPMAPHINALPDRLGADEAVSDVAEAVQRARVYVLDRLRTRRGSDVA
jgi:methanogenic corrinoid protein MtbC1